MKDQIGRVIGQIPSGVFILVASNGAGQKTGMLTSWVQQASFEPPQVTVAINQSRYLNDWLTTNSAVTLNQVPKGDSTLFKHFGKGFEPDEEAFEGVPNEVGNNGLPILRNAMTSMEGRVVSKMEAGDHTIVLLEIATAKVHDNAAEFGPFVHLRKNGFNY